MKSFAELGLSPATLAVLKRRGFEVPTPIQEKTIPAVLAGKQDLIGQAQTGTGKTAAFGLPILEMLAEGAPQVQALVLTPTRELAIQVAEELHALKGDKALSIIPIYGGQSMEQQLRSLRKGVAIVVGTPGRICDHLRRRSLKIDTVRYVVLDEADEMLNMGFIEDVESILEKTGPHKRTLLFSATMPPEILRIAERYMGSYDVLKVTQGQLTASKTDQIYFEVGVQDRFEALCRIVDIEENFYGLVFCRTKVDVDHVARHLTERGYPAGALHGDMSQAEREQVLTQFRNKQITVLVATDVAARGIDVQNLTHVINYALPQDPEAYIHRIGRTGRAGKEGNAITFITPFEYRKLQAISKRTKAEIRKAKLPNIQEVIETKRARIKAYLDELVTVRPPREYTMLAQALLEHNKAEGVVAALLRHAFQSDLDENSYTEIAEAVVDRQGKTRLFVHQGQRDGLTRQKLLAFIKDKCGVAADKVQEIQILDKGSFVTLPFHEAEVVLAHFKQHKVGGLFITKVKKGRSKAAGPWAKRGR